MCRRDKQVPLRLISYWTTNLIDEAVTYYRIGEIWPIHIKLSDRGRKIKVRVARSNV